jgi:tetratricopeptide (TPR) repeat protein
MAPPDSSARSARTVRSARIVRSARTVRSARSARSCRPLAVLRLFPALALAVQVGACAGSQRRGSPAPARVVDVDVEPVRVEVSRDGKGGTRVAMFDARELFDEAGAALEADQYGRALALYDRLVASFPDSKLVPAALFNAGLALEGKRDLDGAIARYLDAARRAPATRHGLDAHIRAGAAMAELARWSDALRVLDEVSARSDLGDADRIELHARRGYVLVASGRYAEAERALAAAIELAPRVARDRRLARDSFVAMAHYYLGDIARRQSEAVQLRLPEAQLERDIEARAKLVLVAQRRFEDTIRVGNLHWATAAGFQLGALQEEMWRALIRSPVPPRLRGAEAAIYLTELRALARAHLEKALAAHEMNVRVAEQNAAPTPWSESSRLRAGELRRFLADATSGPTRLPPRRIP